MSTPLLSLSVHLRIGLQAAGVSADCRALAVSVMQSLDGHVGPVERPPAQQHVSDQSLYGGLAYESHEEELLYDLSAD